MLLQKNILLTLLLFLNVSFTFAQTTYIWQDKDTEQMKTFEILLDKGYTFKQILTDSTLPFQKNPISYKFEKEEYCWFRFSIQNNSAYAKEGYIMLVPEIDNTLYYYDFETKKWLTKQAGLAVQDFNRESGIFHLTFQAKEINTFYIKSKVEVLNSQSYPTKLYIHAFSKKTHEQNEQFVVVLWLVVCSIMSMFFIYNLYIYFVFKDNTYLYYLIIVFGGVFYITSFNNIFNFILPFSFYNFQIQPNGYLYFYQKSQMIINIFIWLVLFGYIQFTRHYLQLFIYFPFWDKILKKAIYIISFVYLFNFIISLNTSVFIYQWSSLVANIMVSIVILMMIYVGIHSYRHGHKIGRYFLIANTLPLLFMIALAIYLAIYKFDVQTVRLLPHLALVSQTLTFAIALVARVNLIKDELKEKQLEAKTLQNENEEILARNRYIELENEYIMADMVEAINKEADLQQKMKLEINQKTETEQKLKQKIELEINQKIDLQAKLETNQRELTANMLYLYQKNEMLTSLQKQIENLSYKETIPQNREGIKEIKSAIKNEIQLDTDWDKFKIHFERVHPSFFKELNEKYPTLTPNEIRLAAYYHLNMSPKEIATLLNIHPRSVHKAKSRLNKKMEEQNQG